MNARDSLARRILCVAVVLAAVGVLADSDGREPAPRFTAKTLTGEQFTNDSLKGKIVLLQFWTTWCPYCRSDQSAVDSIHHDLSDKGLIILAVNVGESKKTVKKYLEKNPRSCRIVLTEDTNLAARFAAHSYPVYVLIDRDGNVAGTQNGAGGERALRRLLSRAGLEAD